MVYPYHKGESVLESVTSRVRSSPLRTACQTAPPPKFIGKYEVQSVLGRGATSTVYLATDPFKNRDVAIKLFEQELLSQEGFKRRLQKIFQNEASLVGQLKHPHILEIYDAVTHAQQSYLVMEYLAGGTLEHYCRIDNLLPIEQVIGVIFKITRALDHAYHHGVIHRDIKPANILMTSEGEVKISDFGSALWAEADETQLVAGGSPAYMSPEQIRQDPLSQQTDIYALGIVMYELLTGQHPYDPESSMSLSYQILHGQIINPRVYRTDVCPELEAIVLKALHQDMGQRYESWRAMGDDLLAAASQPIACDSSYESDTHKFKQLQSLEFFQDFHEIQLWEVLRFSSWRKLSRGEKIICEGETGDSFFILAKGAVQVSRGEMALTTLNVGDCFGEMLYFDATSTVRDTSVTVSQDSKVIEIKAQTLNKASDACQVQFNKAYLKILDRKLARMVQLVSGA